MAARTVREIEALSAECPRCGYDQRGAVALWREQCPLDGTCAECGLAFAWREVLNPALAVPQWCVEAPAAPRRFPIQTLLTTLRLLWPAAFWRRVQMHHRTRWGRLISYLSLMLLALAAVTIVTSAGCAALERRDHLRVGPPGATTTASTSEWRVLWHALIRPLSDTSAVTFTWTVPGPATMGGGGGNTIALGPGALAIGTFPGTPPRAMVLRVMGEVGPLWFALGIPLGCGLAFAALPVSRRRAKVRWQHIARVTLYAYVAPLMLVMLALLNPALRAADDGLSAIIENLFMVAVIMFLPFMFAHWLAAASAYLRMRHPWAVAASVVVIGTLLPFAAWEAGLRSLVRAL